MRAFMTKFVAAAVLSVGLLATAGAALACAGGCKPPAPPSKPHNPKPPATPCHGGGCGGGNHGGGHGGGNVNVNVTVKNSVSASANSRAFGSAFDPGISYGGGYGNWSQSQGIPQSVGGLMVVTGNEGGGFEAYEEEATFTSMMILQASCIDDTGVPHPASQVFGDRDVRGGYAGELYRCIAGTHMQVLMARCGPLGGGHADAAFRESSSYRREESASSYEGGYDSESGAYGQGSGYSQSSQGGSNYGGSSYGSSAGCQGMDYSRINFDGGQTLTCQKGQALWFENGALSCKVQIPQRQCNERSLLRRFGAGIKVLTVTRTEKITKRREIARSASYGSASYMTFDGGVGGFVQ